jgi:hypothetical protein
MTPEEAYHYAEIDGPSEETRKIACKDSECAYWYARNIDRCPREDTRTATCKDPGYAYLYAKEIDKCPREDTRKGVCQSPHYAYNYAVYVEKTLHKDTWDAVKNTQYKKKYETFINSKMKEEII